MVMMFVGGIVFIVDGISVLFLLQGIHGVVFFCSRPNVSFTTRTQRGVKLLKPHTHLWC